MEISKDILKHWLILIADDEEDSLDVSRRILLHYGAEVMTATGGHDAFQLAGERPPHLVITDLSMPAGDGWWLVKSLRADSRLAAVPIVALTAHAMLGDADRVIEAGFNGYLSKPIMPKQMVSDLVMILRAIPEAAVRFEGE